MTYPSYIRSRDARENWDRAQEALAFAVNGRCRWFLLCRNPATGTMPHPILDDVPICDRCRAKVEALTPRTKEMP